MMYSVLMTKLGMTQVVSEQSLVPVTLLKIMDNSVILRKTEEKHGYNALVIGFSPVKKQNVINKPMGGFFKSLGSELFSRIIEMRCDEPILNDISSFKIENFKEGEFIDVRATSKGKGFAGAMKRHGFSGCRATHGVSLSHRVHGSTGNRTLPGRVFKNKKMAGHLGSKNVTIQNLKIFSVDTQNGIIAVIGAVPGYSGSCVLVKNAVKK